MKFLSASQIREADAYTIDNKPIPSIQLMEKAASLCTDWIVNNLPISNSKISVYCGTGNNGGDGLVIARFLKLMNFDVDCIIIGNPTKGSEDFLINKKELKRVGLLPIIINEESNLSNIKKTPDFIIDALLGTGLTRPAEGLIGAVIEHINNSNTKRIAIDLPSGLYVDKKHQPEDLIIKADYTLTFQCPKLNFILPNYAEYVGEWHILDIGLMKSFIDDQESNFELLTKDRIAGYINKRKKFSHKGTYGHAVIIAGSKGKFGAAVLATNACLRSGVGLCTVHSSTAGHDILQLSCPEAMFFINSGENTLESIASYSFFEAKTIGVGPGIGLNDGVRMFFKDLIKSHDKPMVIDADALTILSESRDLLSMIPQRSILTPHPKEFERLFGAYKNDHDLIKLQKECSEKLNCFIILKGAHTRISTPDGMFFINSTGNPGMAKGGSGDVLTGILTALLSQGYEPEKAALLGVYIHGFAGDLASADKGEVGMLPSDLIDQIPKAFEILKRQN